MKTNWFDHILIGIGITYLFALLPLFDSKFTGELSTLFTIRGYNLLENSFLGILPLIVPILTAVIASIQWRKIMFERMALTASFSLNILCYLYSYHAEWIWLETIGSTDNTICFGSYIYPLGGLLVLILIQLLDKLYCYLDTKEILIEISFVNEASNSTGL